MAAAERRRQVAGALLFATCVLYSVLYMRPNPETNDTDDAARQLTNSDTTVQPDQNQHRPTARRKNVLFLVSDDMRPQLGAYMGPDFPSPTHPPMHTPNLDALAAKSLLLRRAYVQQAHCLPSRTSLLTSRRPDTSRVWTTGASTKRNVDFTTIPGYFKQHDYTTVGLGKIFHGEGTLHDEQHWSWPHFHGGDRHWHNHSWAAIPDRELKTYPLIDEQLTNRAIEAMRELSKDETKPFFLALGFIRPHMPWYFPESMLRFYPEANMSLPHNPYVPSDFPQIAWHKYDSLLKFEDLQSMHVPIQFNVTFPAATTLALRRAYYCCVTWVDQLVGRVLGELDRLGLADSTIVSFWGDHGWQLGEHAEWQKMTNFELATHAPMMIRVPGLTDSGVITRQITEFVDLYPTLVEAAGLPLMPRCPNDSREVRHCTEGESLMPLIKDPHTAIKTAAFSQYNRRVQDSNKEIDVMGYSIRTDRYRYTEWVKFRDYAPVWTKVYGLELYDHLTDPDENVNVVHRSDYTGAVYSLSRRLHAGWREAIVD